MFIKQLVLKNFLSFEDLTLDIDGVKAIQGENLDNDDQETNGTGKSAIQSGIEYALFASTSRVGITSKDLIKWGKSGAYIQLTIYCPFRQETLIIERNIGKGSKLDLTVNSEPMDFATVNDGNSQIINWIGISKEDLQNYYIINKERYSSYYTSSNTKKLQMIGRFSNLSILDDSDKVVNSYADDVRKEISGLESEIDTLKGRNLQLKDSIESEKNRDFETEFENKKVHLDRSIFSLQKDILMLTEQVDESKLNIDTYNHSLFEIEPFIKEKEEEIKEFIIPNIDEEKQLYQGEIDSHSTSYNFLNDKKNELVLNLNTLLKEEKICENNLTGLMECPKCNHKFNPSKDVDTKEENDILDQVRNLILQVEEEVVDVENKMSVILSNIDSLKQKKIALMDRVSNASNKKFGLENELRKLIRDKNKVIRDLEAEETFIDSSNNKVTFKNERISEFKETLENLEINEVDVDAIAEFENKIIKHEKSIEEKNLDIDEANEVLFQITQWIHNFKMFRSHLSMDVLNVISGYTNKFLKELKSDLQVRWDGFKVKSDGSLSDKITPQIVRNGEQHPFGSFSGGERGRLEYANILTSQYLINSTHEYGGLNFLFTDEITEGIDGRGLDNLINALKDLNIPILLTTHVSNNSVQENTLLVRKQNGVSKIVTNEDISN